jgi:acyl-CoA thioesterase
MGTPFAEATTVQRVGDGRYVADLDPSWNLMPLPQGGIVTAIAVKAMEAELGHESQVPRTLHTTYIAQVADGPLEIAVDVLRAGRSMSQLRAEVRNPGSTRGHVTTCVFGAQREGFAFTDLERPSAPPPEECPSWRDPVPEGVEARPLPFWEQRVEGRNVAGHAPWEQYEPGPAARVMWYRLDDPPVLDDGRLDPLGLVVLADTMPGAVHERVGPWDRPWFAPSVDLTLHLLDECRSEWVLAHNRARWAGDGYASADMALWDGPRLVAYATQLFLFTFAS